MAHKRQRDNAIGGIRPAATSKDLHERRSGRSCSAEVAEETVPAANGFPETPAE